MKKRIPSVAVTVVCSLIMLCCFQLHAQLSNYATIPYSTGFESGTLDANWFTQSSTADGRIQIWDSGSLIWGGDTAKAHTGIFWLGLDTAPPGPSYTTKEAWMGLNLTGLSSVYLDFWFSDWDDEPEVQDGIFISTNGGTTFTKVLDINGDNYTDLQWYHFHLNLDSINNANSLSFTSTYVVKFQEYDDYYFAGGNDGFRFDDISVSTLTVGSPENELKDNIALYPNPTRGDLFIALGARYDHVTVKVLNYAGQIISTDIFNASSREIRLNVADYPAGIYLIEIQADGQTATVRLMKE